MNFNFQKRTSNGYVRLVLNIDGVGTLSYVRDNFSSHRTIACLGSGHFNFIPDVIETSYQVYIPKGKSPMVLDPISDQNL